MSIKTYKTKWSSDWIKTYGDLINELENGSFLYKLGKIYYIIRKNIVYGVEGYPKELIKQKK